MSGQVSIAVRILVPIPRRTTYPGKPAAAGRTRAVQRAIARGDVDPAVDAEWISDLLTGPLLMRALLPVLQEIDERLIENTLRASMNELGLGTASRSSCREAL